MSSTLIDIQLQEAGGLGRYTAHVDDHADQAELTFSRLDAETVIADHTWVPNSLRGQGVAQALVERLMDDARARGFRVVPRCSYVRTLAARHPEWDDVIQFSSAL
jgi:predicted GNAT family acetyltransferase